MPFKSDEIELTLKISFCRVLLKFRDCTWSLLFETLPSKWKCDTFFYSKEKLLLL